MFDFREGLLFGVGCILALGAGTMILPITIATGVRIAQSIGVVECTPSQVQNQK
jgi:hypothetical protein